MKPFFYSLFILSLIYLLASCSTIFEKRTSNNFLEDQNIINKFNELYYADKDLYRETHINFTSYNLQPLMTGQVPTEQHKQQLNNIINQVKTVQKHFNEVEIRAPTSIMSRSNDSYITAVIKASIFNNVNRLEGAQVKVVTENSSVFLMGLLTQKQADQITEIARTTRGTKRVIKLFEYIDTPK